MQLFVESWKPALHHLNGPISLGFAAVHSKGGTIVPYTSRGRALYIHYLDVGSLHNGQLQTNVDPATGKSVGGRLSPPNADWWLSHKPTAYAVVDPGSGPRNVRASLAQFENPIPITGG